MPPRKRATPKPQPPKQFPELQFKHYDFEDSEEEQAAKLDRLTKRVVLRIDTLATVRDVGALRRGLAMVEDTQATPVWDATCKEGGFDPDAPDA